MTNGRFSQPPRSQLDALITLASALLKHQRIVVTTDDEDSHDDHDIEMASRLGMLTAVAARSAYLILTLDDDEEEDAV